MHCGDVETAVPHHRLNRGMGGSKVRDVPSNIIALCSFLNGRLEDAKGEEREVYRRYGWRLVTGQDPSNTPVYYVTRGEWFMLNDDYGITEGIEYANH